jgi:hypothetical protein
MPQSRVESIYLIHHSHTDVGYTHDQPIVWDLHRRFADAALDQCESGLDSDDDASFRWTVETTAVLEHWVRASSDRQIARFVELAKAGRIEVTAMLANLTPLYDTDQLIESFRPLRFIRDELGLPVEHAMNSDVNGENWPLVDVLHDLGIQAFSMSINTHFGGALEPHPLAFRWEGPSGRIILAWNGFSYGLARELGIGRDARQLAEEFWPRLDAWLASIDYPLPALMLQIYHPFGDNASADPHLSEFVRHWNATGGPPRLRLALPRDWWQVVAAHVDRLPTLRGDWTDYWNFGCASTAREVAINRASRSRLFVADAAWAVVSALGGEADPARQPAPETREAAHRALNLFDEHTWGADCSIRRPQDEDTLAQWHHKASYAYTARSLSLLLARDGIAELARRVRRAADDRLLVFNPLPWVRTVADLVQDPDPPAQRGAADDPTASRHYLDRVVPPRPSLVLAPTRVPAFGYALVAASSLTAPTVAVDDAATVENHRHRLTFDREHGGVQSWFDRDLGRELVDGAAGLAFGGFIHERVAEDGHPWPRRLIFDRRGLDLPPHRGWNPDWPAERRAATMVREHRVERSALGIRVIQRLEAPGVRSLTQEVFLPTYRDHVEFSSAYEMTDETQPEATYVAFPFDVPNARARLDLGGQALEPGDEQLPGACRDYFTVQCWVDFSNRDLGVTVACPTTPMVQLGGFHFGKKQARFELGRALLLGWPTNNYWETNFAATQSGLVTARYIILPHRGSFSEAAAHRFGLEQAVPVSFQHLGEEPVDDPALPRQETLLELPENPVLTLRVKPADAGDGLIVRLLNASDRATTARLGSGLLHIRAAERCDLLEHPLEPIPVVSGRLAIELPARWLVSVHVLADGP